MKNDKESIAGTISKWVTRTLGSAVAIVGIIWVGLQYGSKQYDLGYSQGHGDTQVLRQLIEHKDDEINSVNDQIKVINESLDSLNCENAKLKDLLKSNVVVSDTIIYKNDGIALFDGHVTISCQEVFTQSTDSDFRTQAELIGWIFEEAKEDKYFSINGFVGNRTTFKFEGKKYLVVILGCKEYNKLPGVKIAVYNEY